MIVVEDLVGRPYPVDRCIGAVREVLRRRFPGFRDREIPNSDDEAIEWLANPPSRWREVGRSYHQAGLDGDVIYGVDALDAYIVVVVDAVGRIGLTATKERGIHTFPLRLLTGVRSVQRRCG